MQIAATSGGVRLYSRSGDDISDAFPDLVEAVTFQGVLDGELLVKRAGEVASFNDLQQRLNRKAVTGAHARGLPGLRASLRHPVRRRRGSARPCRSPSGALRLEAFFARERPARMDSRRWSRSTDSADLERLRGGVRGTPIEGLMLKRKDSPYLAGRPKGQWWKWKRDAHLLDVVLMYAQRGHGKRSSFYSDFTFGAWRDGHGRARAGPGRQGLFGLHRRGAARSSTAGSATTPPRRYGPVREVTPALVLEVAFDSVHRSTRHKSGVAMRFPAHPPHPLGQAGGRGGPAGARWSG